MEKPSTFMVMVSNTWVTGDDSTYDPTPAIRGTYTTKADAFASILTTLQSLPKHSAGYNISIFALGPRFGFRGNHTEFTHKHPDATSLITALEKNFKHR